MDIGFAPNRTIEVVQVRLFNQRNAQKVIDIFDMLSKTKHPWPAKLLQNPTVSGDWSIWFLRSGRPRWEKSPEAVECAAALRSFGYVDHVVWLQAAESSGVERRCFPGRPIQEQS
jgi:hypothetical protein